MAGNEAQVTPEELMQRMASKPQAAPAVWDGLPGTPAGTFEELESQNIQVLSKAVLEVNDDLQRHKKATSAYVIAIFIAMLLLVFLK